jgi:hypothetical protein
METPEHQEWRSRQALSWSAVFKAGFGAGLMFFVLSGGTPWSTAGTMNGIMGRDVPGSWIGITFCHFLLSFVYMFVIGSAIYRFRPPVAVPLGILVTMGLYLINVLIFRMGGMTMSSPEGRAVLVHLMFGLFGSLFYKALSVPKPLPA